MIGVEYADDDFFAAGTGDEDLDDVLDPIGEGDEDPTVLLAGDAPARICGRGCGCGCAWTCSPDDDDDDDDTALVVLAVGGKGIHLLLGTRSIPLGSDIGAVEERGILLLRGSSAVGCRGGCAFRMSANAFSESLTGRWLGEVVWRRGWPTFFLLLPTEPLTSVASCCCCTGSSLS